MALTDTFVRQVKHSGKASGDKHADGQGLQLFPSLRTCERAMSDTTINAALRRMGLPQTR